MPVTFCILKSRAVCKVLLGLQLDVRQLLAILMMGGYSSKADVYRTRRGRGHPCDGISACRQQTNYLQ